MTRIAVLLAGLVVAVSVVAAQPDTFEVASVKPMGDAPGEALAAFGSGCDGSFPRVENNRFVVTTTPFALITWAYGYNDRGGCSFTSNGNLITGGPSWVRNERFEIQAVLPAGAPAYTLNQFLNGQTPRLEAMLRNVSNSSVARRRRMPRCTHSWSDGAEHECRLPSPGNPFGSAWAVGPIRTAASPTGSSSATQG